MVINLVKVLNLDKVNLGYQSFDELLSISSNIMFGRVPELIFGVD